MPAQNRLRWHDGALWSVGLLVISRIVLLGLAPLAEPYKRPHFFDDPARGYYWHSERRSSPFYELTPDILVDMWARSDSWQYLDIAQNGYYLEPGSDGYGTVACFPFYPLLVRVVAKMLGDRYLVAALLVSTIAAWGSSVLLYRLALEWRGRECARLATLALFSFPSAFFLTTVFPHALFLAMSLACVLCVIHGRWISAGIFAALAGLSRAEGIVLLPTMALAYWRINGLGVKREAFGLLLCPLGFVGYMAYLWWRFGDPLAFVAIHSQFGRSPTNPFWTLLRPIAEHIFNVRHFLTYLVACWLVVSSIQRAPLAAQAFGWMLFLVPLATGQYESIYRIQLTTFPVYLGIAAAPLRWTAWCQIAVFTVLQVAMCFWFVAGVRLN